MTHDPGGRSKPRWPADSVVSAIFGGPDDCYRYELSEVWNPSLSLCMWLMMNPSVAGIEHSDPTLRRTGTYSRKWGYGGQLVGNVHAYRTTHPSRMLMTEDPLGPDNIRHLIDMAKRSAIVVLAYGKPPSSGLRAKADATVTTLSCVPGVRLSYLERSLDGTPKHPLYLSGDLVLKPFFGGHALYTA